MTAVVAQTPSSSTRSARPLGAVLVAVGVPMFMVTLDNLVVTNALPVMRTQLHASLADLQWFVNAYTLSFASLLLTAASLGDRIGRRRMFLVGIALFTAASAACALATEPWMLIAARAVQGCGAAAVMPLSLTLLTDAVPERMRSAAIGIWGGISGLGIAVGPVIGGAVVDGLSWHWIFWLNVPVGVVILPVVARVLPTVRGGARQLDPFGLVLSAAGVLGIVWGVVHGAGDGWTSAAVLGPLLGGVALVLGFIGWERRASAPMLPLRLFSKRAFSVINAAGFTFSVGVFGSIFLMAQFFQVVQGYSPLESGLRTLPWTIAPLVVSPLAGLVVDRVGARPLIVAGNAMLAAALAWTALTATTHVGFLGLLGPFLLGGIGMGLTFVPASTVVMAGMSEADRGVASGSNNTIREVGVAMGVAVLASVFASHGSYRSPADYVNGLVPAIWVGAAIVAVGAVTALALPSRSR